MSIFPTGAARLTAGDSWAFDYPAGSWGDLAGWSLFCHFVSDTGAHRVVIEGRAGADRWHFTAGPAETAVLPAGSYQAVLVAVSAKDRIIVDRQPVTVLPDPLVMTDQRSRAARILAAIEATIEGRATKDADSYSIEGRSIARTPIADLLRLRQLYKAEVTAERNPNASPVKYRRIKL